MPMDYNPYVNGVKVMTSAEMQRHALHICNMLNSGSEVLSRDVAFLTGFDVTSLTMRMREKKLRVGVKVLGCRYVYNKEDVLDIFEALVFEGRKHHRINPYNGKSVQVKDNAKLMQMVYNNLKG
jgi:hypothetical protein